MSDFINELKKKFAGENTLDVLVEVIKEELAGKLSVSDVIDNLTSEDSKRPLSAKQGKVLRELVENINSSGDPNFSEDEVAKIKELVTGNTSDFLTISQVLTVAENGGLLDTLGIEVDPEVEEDEVELVSAALVQVIALSLSESVDDLTSKIESLEAKTTELEAALASFEEISKEDFREIWNRVTIPETPEVDESTVVVVGGNTYDSLEEAIASETGVSNITLLNDYALSTKLTVGRELELDLGGKTLSCDTSNYVAVNNGATLTITNGTVSNDSERAIQVSADAKLVLGEGAVVESTASGKPAVLASGGNVTVNGGEVSSSTGIAIQAQSKSKVVIEDGEISGKTYAIKATSGSSIEVKDGNITGEEGAIYASDTSNVKSTVTITGGTISADSYAVIPWDDVVLTVDGGAVINGAYPISTNGSANPSNHAVVINVNNATIKGTAAGAYLPAGTLNIGEGAIIEGPSGIVVRGGNLVVNGGEIKATGSDSEESNFGDAKYALKMAGIVIDKNESYQSGNVNVTINGGKITGNPSVRYTENGEEKTESENIHVKGGTFSDNSAASFVKDGTLKDQDGSWVFESE